MPTALSVNLNKIALIRNSREGNHPNVVDFAKGAIDAGAQGITVHPRPDQRHIRPDDVYQLSSLINQHSSIEFNIEGNPFADALNDYPGLLALIDKTRPNQATLVPDNDTQLTSDHGFDLFKDIEQIEQAKKIGADRIELYTGPYAQNFQDKALFNTYYEAAMHAHRIGLGVNAGHDLNLDNLKPFLTIPNIAEVSIGHALTVDALLRGYKNTVTDYSQICQLG